VFSLLAQAGWMDATLQDTMQRMVGFRNIAVHDDQKLLLPILQRVVTVHLNDFLRFTAAILKKDSA
jgi:uncharacterized protein YutE (UPF0331/DUF86 family)